MKVGTKSLFLGEGGGGGGKEGERVTRAKAKEHLRHAQSKHRDAFSISQSGLALRTFSCASRGLHESTFVVKTCPFNVTVTFVALTHSRFSNTILLKITFIIVN